MPLLTAPSMPALSLTKSHFVPGPAVEKASVVEGAQGVNPGNVPFNAKMSSHPNALGSPSRLPFTVGAAAAGAGRAGQGVHDDDQRDDQSTAPSTGMHVALQWDETGKSKPPRGPPGGPGDD
eukprot:2170463-Pyramimonas_sp.AAC.1